MNSLTPIRTFVFRSLLGTILILASAVSIARIDAEESEVARDGTAFENRFSSDDFYWPDAGSREDGSFDNDSLDVDLLENVDSPSNVDRRNDKNERNNAVPQTGDASLAESDSQNDRFLTNDEEKFALVGRDRFDFNNVDLLGKNRSVFRGQISYENSPYNSFQYYNESPNDYNFSPNVANYDNGESGYEFERGYESAPNDRSAGNEFSAGQYYNDQYYNGYYNGAIDRGAANGYAVPGDYNNNPGVYGDESGLDFQGSYNDGANYSEDSSSRSGQNWLGRIFSGGGLESDSSSSSEFDGAKTIDYDRWVEYNVQQWKWQILPAGLIYPSYLAGRKEPRLESVFTYDDDYGWLWDISLGGRAPILRYGTTEAVLPEGFQIDLEGAALLRLDFERERELAGTDYRAGVPITYGTKHWQFKTGYYHVSSHLGDNYLLGNFKKRIHYVRDEIILGAAYRPIPDVRLYAETGWAFKTGETTDPWEFQFGAEYSPVFRPGRQSEPFAAVNAHLFEELDFSGYLNSQIGWQWRGPTNNLLRLGFEFYTGCDDLFQFHYVYQKKYGFGLWYDF